MNQKRYKGIRAPLTYRLNCRINKMSTCRIFSNDKRLKVIYFFSRSGQIIYSNYSCKFQKSLSPKNSRHVSSLITPRYRAARNEGILKIDLNTYPRSKVEVSGTHSVYDGNGYRAAKYRGCDLGASIYAHGDSSVYKSNTSIRDSPG